MLNGLRLATVLVPDYDQAIDWYTHVLGLRLLNDDDLGGGKRWVVVAPAGSAAGLLLAKPKDETQALAIGRQTGGRVAFFLTSDDFCADYRDFAARGVRFLETPRQERYGMVVQFADPWGNSYDLLESPAPAPISPAQQSASFASASPAPHNQAAGASAEADARGRGGRAAQHNGSYVSSAAAPPPKQASGNRARRWGFVGIIVPFHTHGPEIQRIISEHAELVQGRLGLPHLDNDTIAVINLIVHACPEELGSLTGRLGRLEGVTVKSGLAPLKEEP